MTDENSVSKLIDSVVGMKRIDMFTSIIEDMNQDEAKSLAKLLSMFHDKAHKHGWKSDGTCDRFDRMLLIMMTLGQRTANGDGQTSSNVSAGKLLSHESVRYVLSGLTNEPKDYYDQLTVNERECISKIAEHAINERMKSMMQAHIDNGKMMQPVAMDGNMLFEMVMDAALLVYRTGRHGQMTAALEDTFKMIDEDDET